MSGDCRVRIVLKGEELEVEGDKDFVLQMLERFGHTVAAGRESPEEEEKPESDAPAKVLSVREFIQSLGMKKHVDRVAAFGYYLEHYGGKSEFTAADINNCYYEAKMESSNTSQAIILNIKRGHMMEAKGGKKTRKKFTLTQTGEKFVSDRLAKSRKQ